MAYISVVTAAYNCENSIAKTIQGIIDQSYSDWEMVIIDDCSTDLTWQVMNDLASKDQRIRIFKNIANRGFAFSRDKAIRESTGEIIVINDADDVSFINRLEVIADHFRKNKDLTIFYSNVDYFYPESGKTEKRFFQPFNKMLLTQINYIPDPGAAFRRDAYLELGGYDIALKVGADYDLWLRALKRGMTFSYSEESLSNYTKKLGTLTSNDSPEAIRKRQEWNKKVREKNKISVIDPKIVEAESEPKVREFYLNKSFEVWFGKESLPES